MCMAKTYHDQPIGKRAKLPQPSHAKRQRTLSEQVADAQREVRSWSPEKRDMMRLEGCDPFHERMRREIDAAYEYRHGRESGAW